MIRKSIFWLLILSFLLTIIESNTTITYLQYGTSLFIYNIFPTLFPTLIITDIIIKYNLANFLIPYLSKITKIIYKIEGYPSLIIFLSLLTGTPGNAKLISSAYQDNYINKDTANKLINITHTFNPMLCITTFGLLFFNDVGFGIMLFLTMIITNIIIARFIQFDNNIIKKPDIIQQQVPNNIMVPNNIISQIILSNFKILIIILGIIIISTIIIGFISLLPINLNNYLGLIEFTTGVKIVSISNIPAFHKYLLTVIFLNFGSLSIIMQNISIMNNIIDKKSYIQIRIIASIISIIIFIILFFTLNWS